MYATCLFCHAALGANESIEHFPVGKRLAFDAAKGRLWVVCTKCERWNLSPIEERWEAIEEAERAYRDTKKRVATDNVGLARLNDGTDLIRIGAPLRPEFAAWRYGDSFGRRRRKNLLVGASAVVGGGALIAGAGMGLFAIGGTLLTFSIAPQIALRGWLRWNQRAQLLTLVDDNGERIKVSPVGLSSVIVQSRRSTPDDPGQLALSVIDADHSKPMKSATFTGADGIARSIQHRATEITGAAAHRALAQIMAKRSGIAGSRQQVADALALLADARSPTELLDSLPAELTQKANQRFLAKTPSGIVMVSGLAPHARLALEMSLHEDSERRALEGELHELALRWKEAEEIAAISDSLFLADPSPNSEQK